MCCFIFFVSLYISYQSEWIFSDFKHPPPTTTLGKFFSWKDRFKVSLFDMNCEINPLTNMKTRFYFLFLLASIQELVHREGRHIWNENQDEFEIVFLHFVQKHLKTKETIRYEHRFYEEQNFSWTIVLISLTVKENKFWTNIGKTIILLFTWQTILFEQTFEKR